MRRAVVKWFITGGSWSSYWTNQSEVLFFGEISKITDGKLYNQKTGATDYLTVTGVAGSYTFQCPNTAPYIAADTDYIWFKTNEAQRTPTEAELIGYDFTRTIVKYQDNVPNHIETIMILSSDYDTGRMRNDFRLSIWWSGVSSLYGYTKSNRTGEKSEWTPEVIMLPREIEFLTELSASPTSAHLALITKTFNDLNAVVPISQWDVLVLPMGNTTDSRKNWIKTAHIGIPQASPTFTPGVGYGPFNGSTQYFDPNYSPRTEGVNYTLNSATYIIIFGNESQAAALYQINGSKSTTGDGGAANRLMLVRPHSADEAYNCRMHNNDASLTSASTERTSGVYLLTRTSSTIVRLFVNKILKVSSTTSTSTKIPDQTPYIGCELDFSGIKQYYTKDLMNGYAYLNGVSDAQGDAITDILNYYIANVVATL